MFASVEVSLYPLTENYRNYILEFVQKLSENPNLKIQVTGLSTQIFGDYDVVMTSLNEAMKEILLQQKACFTLKVVKGERTPEKLGEDFKKMSTI